MCITKDLEGKEESLIGDDDGLQHAYFSRPSSPTHDSHTPRNQAPDPAALLPVQLQKILADPGAYSYRCDLCISRLALKPGALPQTRPHPRHAFQFGAINQHAGLVPLNDQSQHGDYGAFGIALNALMSGRPADWANAYSKPSRHSRWWPSPLSREALQPDALAEVSPAPKHVVPS
ncbi:hypothetical protein PtA15_12A49 [Puccinia triticina]|uniref:Uncharacterized protein n=1 Tax=Puccinia triticina TaxID=208348 RepID=A0ABY7CXN4_9BASI|nr:uncharacterized protein PtA15_12A49 [Puccinia triticina]WAQ90064.1 hypothetical protein PtA15_12A49 [Puccinia triticina]